MSELSKKNSPSVTEKLGGTAALGTEQKPASKAVRIWAVLGGLILALQVYVWIRWITGPYFERVPAGPSDPPTLMKTILTIWTGGIIIGFPIAIYWWIIRPWRRERRITLDGILLVSMGLIRGRTIVERGLDQVRGGFVRQQLTRFLAVFAAVSAIFFVFYNVPAQWFGQQADPWPADIQERSYFTAGLCGEGTDKPCPHPDLPMPRHDSGYIDKNGRLVLPDGVEVPPIVPFERED